MFCCDLLESKENKVELDFDEHVFNSILDWIHSGSFFIQMENVIIFYETADYLMINESLFQPCISYFHENFTIEHLPVVLAQVTKVSKLMNSSDIESLICRHFLVIANTDIFLDYPVETVEAILKLDLMVFSEYQIVEAIIKWVNKSIDCRKRCLSKLLSCICWCYMDTEDLSKVKNNELFKTLPNIDEIISSNSEKRFNRSKQIFFVSIQHVGLGKLRLKVFDNEFYCFTIGDFTEDDTLSLEFVHGENILDILYDSGRKGIRVDWNKKTFRWLDFRVPGKTYFSQLCKFIVKFSSECSPVFKPKKNSCYLDDKDGELPNDKIKSGETVFLESNGTFISIGKTTDGQKWFGLFPVRHESWFNNYRTHVPSFRATVLRNIVYILTEDLEFIQFNYETKCFNKSEPFKGEKWNFIDLILTSHQANDDKVILVNKSTGKVFIFCIYQMKWIEKYRIMNVDFCSTSCCYDFDKLTAFTPAWVSMKVIKPLYEQYARQL